MMEAVLVMRNRQNEMYNSEGKRMRLPSEIQVDNLLEQYFRPIWNKNQREALQQAKKNDAKK